MGTATARALEKPANLKTANPDDEQPIPFRFALAYYVPVTAPQRTVADALREAVNIARDKELADLRMLNDWYRIQVYGNTGK